jgi:diaminopimelate decarboxylase
MQTILKLKTPFYILADKKIKRNIDKFTSLTINIPSIELKLNGKDKHFVIATTDYNLMHKIKQKSKHEYPIVDILLSDVLNYCQYSSTNLIIFDSKLHDKTTTIETIVYDVKETSFYFKNVNLN